MIEDNMFLIGGVIFYTIVLICFVKGFMPERKQMGFILRDPFSFNKIYKSQDPKSFWFYFILYTITAAIFVSFPYIFDL